MKRTSNGNSICLSFSDLFTATSFNTSLQDTFQVKVIFKVIAKTYLGSEVRISGNIKELGQWDPEKSIRFFTNNTQYPLWTSPPISISIPSLPFKFEYKYIIASNRHFEWEKFSINRKACIKDKCTFWTTYEVSQSFNELEDVTFELQSEKKLISDFFKVFQNQSTNSQLQALQEILDSVPIDYSVLQMASITIKSIMLDNHLSLGALSAFAEWCGQKLSLQQTRILLSAIRSVMADLQNPSESLLEKLDKYENSFENSIENSFENSFESQALLLNFNISQLRYSILQELNRSSTPIGLIFADNYLESKEFELVRSVVDELNEEDCVWKIILLGKWMCEMLFYNYIKSKQVVIVKSQFEKLEKNKNLQVLRDLLYELLELVVDEYCEILLSVNHWDCEVLCKSLNVEYKLLYFDLFTLITRFLIKAIPLVNKELHLQPFVCFYPGTCRGTVNIRPAELPSDKYCILFINEINEYFDLENNVCGVLSAEAEHLLQPLFISSRLKQIPIAVGYLPALPSQDYSLIITEDLCYFHNSNLIYS